MQQSQFVIQNKEFFRKLAKETRKILFDENKLNGISAKIVENIKKHDSFKNAKNVMLFYPTKFEINLLGLIKEDKKFYLPRCKDEFLEVCPYKNGDTLQVKKYNIQEPITKPIDNLSIIDIVVVPALCADLNFNRLGYGGGFYDRFLSSSNLIAKKIVVVPDELLYQTIPTEPLDVKMDLIITQTKILPCNIS